jgi:type VI secretion system protein ImpH
MAGSNRASSQALEFRTKLAADPYRFEFFQALRMLEALNADKPRIGKATRASQESVRLGQEPSMAFATSMLASFTLGDEKHKDRLDVRFMGLFGPNGPLPLHLTEFARDRDRQEKDPTFRRFADVFHHRMLSLFYRAWADSQPTVNFDRADEDRFFDYVGSLIGIGLPGARDYDELPDHSRLYLAGLLAMQNRPAAGLRCSLEEYLQVPVEVDEFVGEWLKLPEDALLRLGRSPLSGILGQTTTAGEKTWFCQGKIRIVCGPLHMESFRRLLPDRYSLPGLTALVRNYCGDEIAWELNLVLIAAEVPSVTLGVAGQLGWTSWMGNRTSPSDAGDVRLNPA